jgi:hypothetical protein
LQAKYKQCNSVINYHENNYLSHYEYILFKLLFGMQKSKVLEMTMQKINSIFIYRVALASETISAGATVDSTAAGISATAAASARTTLAAGPP